MLYYFPFQSGSETLPVEDNPLLAEAGEEGPTQSELGPVTQDPTQAADGMSIFLGLLAAMSADNLAAAWPALKFVGCSNCGSFFTVHVSILVHHKLLALTMWGGPSHTQLHLSRKLVSSSTAYSLLLQQPRPVEEVSERPHACIMTCRRLGRHWRRAVAAAAHASHGVLLAGPSYPWHPH